MLIPIVLKEFDTLSFDSTNRRQLQTIRYEKTIGPIAYTLEYVAEIRNKRKVLALNTMYKNPSLANEGLKKLN